MSTDNYLELLNKNIEAATGSNEELIPLLHWLRHWRPAKDDVPFVDYLTTAEIQSAMSDMVNIDLNLISTIMWRLGYEVSVAATHPAWGMIMTD